MKNNRDKKYLEETPLSKLLYSLSMPAFVGMIVMAAYNVVDTIFVGHGVGPLAIAGLTIIFPIQMINTAVAISLGIGAASIVSRRLGEQKVDDAALAAGNIFSLSFIAGLFISLCGFIFLDTILNIFGATKDIKPFASDYFSIVLFGSPLISFAMAGNNIVRAEGEARMAMITMIISAVVNVILDPIFIFGFKMGIKGAAWATIISQYSAAGFILWYFKSGRSFLKITKEHLIIKWPIVKETLAIGSSSLIRHASGSLVAVIIIHLLARNGGDIAIAAYGLIMRVMMFAFMPMFGVVQGVQPIIGYNYGAMNFERVRNAVKLAMKINSVISMTGFVILMFFSKWIYKIFSSDPYLLQLSEDATRIVMVALPIVGVQMVGGSFFQSIGKALPALIVSISRQVLYFIPFLLIFSFYYGLQGVWLTFPAADIMALLTTMVLFRLEWKKLPK